MKALTTALVLGLIATTPAMAMEKTPVPEAVENAFKAKFPNAEDVEWERENDNQWEVEFELNDIEYEATFSADGTWLETETEVEEENLPAAVKAALDAKYSDYDLEEIEHVETPTGSFYEMEIDADDEEFEISIDASGQIKVLNEEDERDDD